jgi:chorismate synthase
LADSSFGENFRITVFGESHGPCVGAVVDGCPAGLQLTTEDIQVELERRMPPDPNMTSARREKDEVHILSGVFEGYTTGAPIVMLVWNKDVRSQDYDRLKFVARPGHADYPTRIKFGGFNDFRGGGRASGRMTVPITMAGAIARKLLRTIGVEVFAHTVQVHTIRLNRQLSSETIKRNAYANSVRCADPETAEKMRQAIMRVRREGDSLGGVVECIAEGVPPGVGEPFFDSLDADLAKVAFNIPAVKGFEVGSGFKSSGVKGSENNDSYIVQNGTIETLTNNAGGVLGGLSNGMPIIMRVAFKPTSSIPKEQRTVNIKEMQDTVVKATGRHDPCIVPKAVPVVEAAVAIVLADHCLRARCMPRVLGKRSEDEISEGSKPQQPD